MAVSSTLDPIEKVFYGEGIHQTDPRAAPLKGLRPLRGPHASAPTPQLAAIVTCTRSQGIDSVAVIALESGADAPLVLAVQMLRLFAVIFAGSLLGRWWSS